MCKNNLAVNIEDVQQLIKNKIIKKAFLSSDNLGFNRSEILVIGHMHYKTRDINLKTLLSYNYNAKPLVNPCCDNILFKYLILIELK